MYTFTHTPHHKYIYAYMHRHTYIHMKCKKLRSWVHTYTQAPETSDLRLHRHLHCNRHNALNWTAKASNSQAITPCLNGSSLSINHWNKMHQGYNLFRYEYHQAKCRFVCIFKSKRWQMYVSQKLCVYVCVFVCEASSAGGFSGFAV